LKQKYLAFKKFDQLIPIQEKKLIDNNPSKMLRAISSIPKIVSAGLLILIFTGNEQPYCFYLDIFGRPLTCLVI
tara:strand:- start:2353 stop:2574 length:222 start_codon:yes stop_codon:yes gene_type:complete